MILPFRSLGAFLCLTTCSTAAMAQDSRVLRDVAYVAAGHAEQRLDLTLPTGTRYATMIFVHGGSLLEAGERRSSDAYRSICGPFVAAGAACATIDYRLAPSFRWPAMPEDVAQAVRWVRDAVAQRSGDATRLFLFGHSSGCLLVANLAANPKYLARVGMSPSDIAGIVPMGCLLNFPDTVGRGLTPERVREGFARDQSGVKVFGTADNFVGANVQRQLGPHVPPMLVVAAHEEWFHPPILEQAAKVVRTLIDLGRPAELLLVPGTHMSSIAGVAAGDSTFARIWRFMVDPKAVDRH